MTEQSEGVPKGPNPRLPRWRHVPFPVLIVLAALGFGYYSCDHLVTGFHLFIVGPWVIGLALLLFGASCALLSWRTSKDRRAYVLFLHFPIVVLVAVVSIRHLPPAGKWLWEQIILKPRVEAMVDYARGSSDAGPVSIKGYPFKGAERTAHGALLYTDIAGGPFVSRGIFVPLSRDYRGFSPPQEGEPRSARSVTPTSIDGLYWFISWD